MDRHTDGRADGTQDRTHDPRPKARDRQTGIWAHAWRETIDTHEDGQASRKTSSRAMHAYLHGLANHGIVPATKGQQTRNL